MNILVINCGSSSLKFQLIDTETENVLSKGLIDRIGLETSEYTFKGNGEFVKKFQIKDHAQAVELLLKGLVEKPYGVIKSLNEISAVGHRIVHSGGLERSMIVDDYVMEVLHNSIEFAPLHMKGHISGIEAVMKAMPDKKSVVVFDTTFHNTMPDYAYLYAIPMDMYEKHKVRRYGFHGTSHKYVSRKCSSILKRNDLKTIVCHLGNGASLSAVKNGQCMDTSMGFTPLEGLIMGTRSGDVDPAVVEMICKKNNLTISEALQYLNKKSGLLAISGISSDFRYICDALLKNDKRAELAINMFSYRIKKYIGAYFAVLNGLDCLAFTAGIGENSALAREKICNNMEVFGIELDKEKNNALKRGTIGCISKPNSKVKILVVPTNEELEIALETKNLTK